MGKVTKVKVDVIQVNDVDSFLLDIQSVDETTLEAYVPSLLGKLDVSYIGLAAVLHRIKTQSLFKDCGSLNSYLEKYMPTVKLRRAYYLIAVYEMFRLCKLSWSEVGELGWTKLSRLLPILTEDNKEEWIKTAQTLSVSELEKTIKKSLPANKDVEKKTSMHFQLTGEQVDLVESTVSKVQDSLGVTNRGAVLEALCLDFLSTPGEFDLAHLLRSYSLQSILDALNKLFPKVKIDVDLDDYSLDAELEF